MKTKKITIEINEKFLPELEKKLKPMCKSWEVVEELFDFNFEEPEQTVDQDAAQHRLDVARNNSAEEEEEEELVGGAHLRGYTHKKSYVMLTADQKLDAKKLRMSGMSVKAIANHFGSGMATMSRLLKGVKVTGVAYKSAYEPVPEHMRKTGSKYVAKDRPAGPSLNKTLSFQQEEGLSVEAIAEHVSTANFRDGLVNFHKLGHRTISGVQGCVMPLMVLAVTERWMSATELQYFIGVSKATIDKYMITLHSELEWIDMKFVPRDDGRSGAGLHRRVCGYRIKAEVKDKLIARWGNKKNLAKILSCLPSDMLSDEGRTFTYKGNERTKEQANSTYNLQEHFMEAVCKDLKEKLPEYTGTVR